ncbi:MAG TPA: hypothetical protein VGJ81_12135 [Thermoanaerobaculia bacterium]|jgi:hypothetical protein
MNNIATTRTKIESLLSVQVLLPAMLGVNTLALVALDRLGAFPDWIKTIAALFLAF